MNEKELRSCLYALTVQWLAVYERRHTSIGTLVLDADTYRLARIERAIDSVKLQLAAYK